jgi:hypothetical protein
MLKVLLKPRIYWVLITEIKFETLVFRFESLLARYVQ